MVSGLFGSYALKSFAGNPALQGMTLKALVLIAAAAGLLLKGVALFLHALLLGPG